MDHFLKRLFGLVLLALSASSFAGNWTTYPVPSANGGTTYSLSVPFVPTSVYTTYLVVVVDSLIPGGDGNADYDWTATSSIQIKNSRGGNVCSTPYQKQSGQTFGQATLQSWFQNCTSGTLTNGTPYTVSITGTAYHYGNTGTGAPQVFVYLIAQ